MSRWTHGWICGFIWGFLVCIALFAGERIAMTFQEWLEQTDRKVPLCEWGPKTHDKIVAMYVEDEVKRVSDELLGKFRAQLDEALNSGDGAYRP